MASCSASFDPCAAVQWIEQIKLERLSDMAVALPCSVAGLTMGMCLCFRHKEIL